MNFFGNDKIPTPSSQEIKISISISVPSSFLKAPISFSWHSIQIIPSILPTIEFVNEFMMKKILTETAIKPKK